MKSTVCAFLMVVYLGWAATLDAATVYVEVGDSIQDSVQYYPENTTFVIKAGTHRCQSVSPKDGDSFVGELGPNGERNSIMSGARLLTNWYKNGNWWVHDGIPHLASYPDVHDPNTTYCDFGNLDGNSAHVDTNVAKTCTMQDDLYMDGWFMQQMPSLSLVDSGKFWQDMDNNRVYMTDNPTGHVMEMSLAALAQSAFGSNAQGVTIKDLVVTRYASHNAGFVIYRGGEPEDTVSGNNHQGWVIENIECSYNHSSAIRLDGDCFYQDPPARCAIRRDFLGCVVRGCEIHHNGQEGMEMTGMTGLVVEYNNIHDNWTPALRQALGEWSGANFCGPIKVLNMDSVTFRGNYIHDNGGVAIHVDWQNIHTVFDGNLIDNYQWEGLFLEADPDGGIVRYNVVRRGPTGYPGWFWEGAGIALQSTAHAEVYNNVVMTNANFAVGIGYCDDSRRTLPTVHDWVHNNDVTFCYTDLSTQWGNNDGNMGWGISTWGTTTDPRDTIVQAFQTIIDTGNVRFDSNAYHATPQGRADRFFWPDRNNCPTSSSDWGLQLTFEQFQQQAGMETHGTMDANVDTTIASALDKLAKMGAPQDRIDTLAKWAGIANPPQTSAIGPRPKNAAAILAGISRIVCDRKALLVRFTKPVADVRLSLYRLDGRRVSQFAAAVSRATSSLSLSTQAVPQGTYLCRIEGKGWSWSRNVVLLK